MKATLTEMKNNLQEINCREDEAKNQKVIWNIRKQKYTQSEQQKEKRI